ncbi:YcgN family cysteine cluster protein [Microbulbifer aggregans]|uniref:YcgN family cysteine cluster protein n=1 Tax=Microbulbifer aggregans TaxID=1769779 RepID=UPI001CFE63B8|nr:YcgN family cysteine cluster protein [Microbulbifer aggregans]
MVSQRPFWQRKKLDEMTESEWESLCDGCGRCCLHRLEDEDTGEVYTTCVSCRLLDTHSCRCTNYPQRKKQVPDCIQLQPADVANFTWLPVTCAYRTLAEGRPLADWHPLISGDPNSVHEAGISVQDKVVSEENVDPEDYEDHIVVWVGDE